MDKKVTVLAYEDLIDYIPKNKSILIRMYFEENEDISFEDNYIDKLYVDVVDEYDKTLQDKIFNRTHSDIIYSFIDQYKEVEEIVIHCQAGLSRSPSVAISLLNYIGYKEKALNYIHQNICSPNPLIMEIMNERDFFVEFIEEMKKRKRDNIYKKYILNEVFNNKML